MSLKKLLGLEKEKITDEELRALLAKARNENKDQIEVYGTKIIFRKDDSKSIECGILD